MHKLRFHPLLSNLVILFIVSITVLNRKGVLGEICYKNHGRHNARSDAAVTVPAVTAEELRKETETQALTSQLRGWKGKGWSPGWKPQSSSTKSVQFHYGVQAQAQGYHPFATSQQNPVKKKEPTVLDWASKVFSVKNKSVGEFLRDYQVQLLYDIMLSWLMWVLVLILGHFVP